MSRWWSADGAQENVSTRRERRMTAEVPIKAAGADLDGLIGGAPGTPGRAVDWLRRNLFSSPWNTLLTVLVLVLLWEVVPPFLDWAVFGATVSGDSKAACTGDGACWTFIKLRLHTFMWGHYPDEELWRLGLAAVLLVVFAVPVMREDVRHRGLFVILLLPAFPVIATILLLGHAFALPFAAPTLCALL